MHVDEERLQRLLDGELTAAAEAATRAHLDACAACTGALAAARREAFEVDLLLASLDRPVPRVDFGSVVERAARSPRPALAWGRVAAVILVGFGLAAAAYALPGSPLPRWFASAVAWVGGPPASPRAPEAQRPEAGLAGIAVVPGADLLIRFDSPREGGRLQVRLVDDASVAVRTTAGAASFTTGADLLGIDLLEPDVLVAIDVPRTAPRVEIRIGERRLFLKEGSRLNPAPPSGDGESWGISLAP